MKPLPAKTQAGSPPLRTPMRPNTSPRPEHSGAGFTLLEILVVMFIIGIIVGFAVLSVDGRAGDDKLQQEAERLDALLGLATDEAILYGVEVGLDLTRDGYRFLRFNEGGWQPIDLSDHPLRPRKLDPGMKLELLEEDDERKRLAQTKKDEDSKEDGLRPEVLFLSSGEVTPFKIELRSENVLARYYFEGELTGKLSMTRAQDE